MANYTSHAIMSEKLYNNLKSKNMLKVNIDINHLKLFSLGQDLTFVGRETFLDTHLNNSRKFFIDTIKYIRDNHSWNIGAGDITVSADMLGFYDLERGDSKWKNMYKLLEDNVNFILKHLKW